jgi:hypothetical protein
MITHGTSGRYGRFGRNSGDPRHSRDPALHEWKPAIVTEHIEVEKKRTPIALMIVHVDGTPRYPSTIYRLYSYHHNTELKQHYTIPPQQ